MSAFNDTERAYYTEMRGLTSDAEGREVLVGLTFEETVFCIEYKRKLEPGGPPRNRDREDRERYLRLHEKYDVARLEVVGSEVHLRNKNPPRH